jgi:ABC-type uncharacterized transport system permease subunit
VRRALGRHRGVLRATRGVSEVISTIMLNFISTSLVAYFLRRVAVREEGSNIVATREIPESSRIPGIRSAAARAPRSTGSSWWRCSRGSATGSC